LIGCTTIEIYQHIGIGLVCCILGFVLYKVKAWSWGDVKLAGVAGLAFGLLTPYVALLAALTMVTWQGIRKGKTGLPFGVPVAVGATLATILSVL
jgi:Flp pilus assembly protein protease CpaA